MNECMPTGKIDNDNEVAPTRLLTQPARIPPFDIHYKSCEMEIRETFGRS